MSKGGKQKTYNHNCSVKKNDPSGLFEMLQAIVTGKIKRRNGIVYYAEGSTSDKFFK